MKLQKQVKNQLVAFFDEMKIVFYFFWIFFNNKIQNSGANGSFLNTSTISKRSTKYLSCGVSPFGTKPTSLIANGNAVEPGDWPWCVAIYYGCEYVCAGSIGEMKISL